MMKKCYSISYQETRFGIYDVVANSEIEAKEKLLEMIKHNKVEDPQNYCDSSMVVIETTNYDGVEIDTMYSPEGDITFIMEYTYRKGDIVAEKVIGFYHGEPDEKDTKIYATKGTTAILV